MNTTQLNRRHLLGLGTSALGALALGRAASAQTAPASNAAAMMPNQEKGAMAMMAASDAELLRAALVAEQVGAAYYAQVLGAQASHVYLSDKAFAAATQMAQHKTAHVEAISAALAGMGGAGTAPTFRFPRTSFVSSIGMAWLGYSLEEIAIGSHLNTLDTLSSRALRPAVAGIIGANSMHAALLRTMSGFEFSPRYFEAKMSPGQVLVLLSAYQG